MTEVLTMAEICARYDSEWVLVEDPQFDEHSEIVGGKVIFHSKSRDEIDRMDLELRPRSAAYVYTGRLAENMAVVL